MERPTGAKLRIRRNGEQKVGTTINQCDNQLMEGGNEANVKWKAVMERPAGAELRFYNNRAAVEYF